MAFVAGVDGCAGGWFVAVKNLEDGYFSYHLCSTFSEVLALRYDFSVIGVDMPIGLLDDYRPGGRNCDVEAKALLGEKRSGILIPPVRKALKYTEYTDAAEVNASSAAEGKKISKQTFLLFPKMREVDEALSADKQQKVIEVHAELSFYEMNGSRPVLSEKKSPAGREERLRLLSTQGYRIDQRAFGLVSTARLQEVDILDACAVCWTAERIYLVKAIRIPKQVEVDSKGLRMEIWR